MSANDGSRSGSSSLTSWFRSLSKGVQWLIGAIITAGALAGAVTAISNLRAPDPEHSAVIDDLSVDRGVSLKTYTTRHGGTALAPSARLQLAAATLAQATTPADPGEAAAEPLTPATPEEEPVPPPPETTTDPGTATTDTTTTEPDPNGDPERPAVSDILGKGTRSGIDSVLTNPATTNLEIPETCVEDPTDPLCGAHFLFSIEPTDEHGPEGEDPVDVVAQRVQKIFRGIRTGVVDQATGKRPLLGVDVNFDVSVTGYNGRKVEVRWSLHRLRNGVDSTPIDWLVDRRVLRLTPDASTAKASPEFWAPLPKGKGTYFIRVGLYDGDTRLATQDTPHFR
jgi:hypothetical protein